MSTTYLFRLLDDAGAPVAGAALAQSSLKALADGSAVTGVTLTPVDLGDGFYSVAYDAASHPEALAKLTPTLAGHSFTGGNAAAFVPLTADSGLALDTNTTVHAAPAQQTAAEVGATDAEVTALGLSGTADTQTAAAYLSAKMVRALLTSVVDGSITVRGAMAVMLAQMGGGFTATNTTSQSLVTLKRQDGATPIVQYQETLDSVTGRPVSGNVTLTNVPN